MIKKKWIYYKNYFEKMKKKNKGHFKIMIVKYKATIKFDRGTQSYVNWLSGFENFTWCQQTYLNVW